MISGINLKNAIISGANNICKSKNEVDKLNIFPVPDGDTGTNMSMTIRSAIKELEKIDGETATVSQVSKIAASQLLRGARGNSGVILSVLFKGLAKGLEGIESADGATLVRALSEGVTAAYKTVMNPTEGTILTVARLAAEKGAEAIADSEDPVYIWEQVCLGANEALLQTPELLPVLKRAGVVDAGGKGLCLIFEGMLSVFKDNIIIEFEENNKNNNNEEDDFSIAIAQYDDNIKFTYCTEFIINKKEKEKDSTDLKEYLQKIGDSIVVVDDNDIIKTHVHTDNPGKALEKALSYGELLTVKIENMKEQNKKIKDKAEAEKPKYAEPTEKYGFVAVAAGEGIQNLFKDLGCNYVVSGGQTMNPSTEDIFNAIQATPAKTVYVLPNNKNIILAAEQTISMCKDRTVVVIPTKTIPQGLNAMLAFDSELPVGENLEAMTESISKVKTGQITTASKNYEYGMFKIKEGEILALKDGIPSFRFRDPVKGIVKLTNSMANKNTSFITIIYGNNISEEQAEKAYKAIQSKYGSFADITLVNGGQPVYHFILSVE